MSANRDPLELEADFRLALRTHYGIDAQEAERRPVFSEDAPYRVVDVIARGGMGSVLRVEDGRLERTLAMKVARGAEGRDDAALLEEARTLGQLQHPGVVPVHDAGLDEEGRAYFTMALVDGESFSSLLARRASGLAPDWSLARCIDLLIKVCDCAGYAHASGVAHGDLKPANVMIGRHGEVYVLDWGVARAIESGAARRVAGTPEYMAPEHIGGAAPSAAGDVFAVGAILREMLTGTPLQGGEGVLGVPRAQAPLLAVSEKATAEMPAARYASMGALAADLRAYLDDRVVRAWSSGPLAELRAWYRRHRRIAQGSAAALFVAALVLAWFLLRLREERDRAELAAGAAHASLREIYDLAVVERIAALRERADRSLWPLAPELVPALRAWMDEAAALRAQRQALVERLGLAGADAASVDPERRFRHRLLERTVEELARFLDEEPPSPYVDSNLGSVAQRLQCIADAEARSRRVDAAARWREAAELLRADPRYAGTELAPCSDLLPLGKDPRSGLLELAHLPTGEAPVRDASGELVLTADSGVVLVLLPGGSFLMGAQRSGGPNLDPDADESNETPVHEVRLDAFLIGKHEMTQAQWARATGANPSNHDARSLFVDDERAPLHPVENVTWLECQELLPRLGLALPTEAQWEHAARAGAAGPTARGSIADLVAVPPAANLSDLARSRALGAQCAAFHERLDDGYVMHAPVGSYPPNAFGLCDLAGNVWEWCGDEYVSYATPPRAGDGARPRDERPHLAIYRGGAFDQLAIEARSANRAGAPVDVRQFTVGVRPVRALRARPGR